MYRKSENIKIEKGIANWLTFAGIARGMPRYAAGARGLTRTLIFADAAILTADPHEDFYSLFSANSHTLCQCENVGFIVFVRT